MTTFPSAADAGADFVAQRLDGGGKVRAANWSEAAQKIRAAGADWDLARGLLLSFDLDIEPVTADDAECATSLFRRGEGLSLGGR